MCAFALTMVLLALPLPTGASASACPNEEVRTGGAGALPDCRAYEMVSPPGSEPFNGFGEGGEILGFEASRDGERMAFYSQAEPTAGSHFGEYYLSSRVSDGWASGNMIPPQSVEDEKWCFPPVLYSPDLSKSILENGWAWGEGYPEYQDGAPNGVECGHDSPLLVAGEPLGAENLFFHDDEAPVQAGFYQLLNLTPAGVVPRNAYFQAASTDFSHVLFTSAAPLTPEAPVPGLLTTPRHVGEDLYLSAGGIVRLVTILPGGEPAWGLPANGSESNVGVSSAAFTHTLSADGERAFFYAGGEVAVVGEHGYEDVYRGNLYLRENAGQPRVEECAAPGRACTVQVDAAQGGPESGGGRLQWATPDGARAFFTDDRRLTADSTAQPGRADLYEYDLNRPLGERLADLTVHGPEPAGVLGVSGISDDGSYVYFAATAALSGEQANSHGDRAQPGMANLYLSHAGAITFIAALAPRKGYVSDLEEGDGCDWEAAIDPVEARSTCVSARVSPDGNFVAFNSVESLTGYDNAVVEPEHPGERDREIFLYEAASDALSCASCDPSGAPPTAPFHAADPRIPAPMSDMVQAPHGTPGYLTRSLSDRGAVFFDTRNRLLPADENATFDVYEYERGGLHLISTGKSPDNSRFRDASATGSDIFFNTGEALVARDSDNSNSLYDARVDGGFAEPPPPAVCEGLEGEASCRASFSSPGLASLPGSATFVGPGNPPPPPPPPPHCKRGFKRVKVHGRYVCRRVHKHRRLTRHAKRKVRG